MAVSVADRPDHENIDRTGRIANQNRPQQGSEGNALTYLSSRIRENSGVESMAFGSRTTSATKKAASFSVEQNA